MVNLEALSLIHGSIHVERETMSKQYRPKKIVEYLGLSFLILYFYITETKGTNINLNIEIGLISKYTIKKG